MSRLVLWLPFAAVMLGACSDLQYRGDRNLPPVLNCGQGINQWLVELHDTRTLTPEQLQATLALREQEFSINPTTENRLRLVMLLITGEDTIKDPQRATTLLQEFHTLPDEPAEQELLAVLRQLLGSEVESGETIDALHQQVKKQEQRIQELEEQQRALTTIEQSIQQRETNGGE